MDVPCTRASAAPSQRKAAAERAFVRLRELGPFDEREYLPEIARLAAVTMSPAVTVLVRRPVTGRSRDVLVNLAVDALHHASDNDVDLGRGQGRSLDAANVEANVVEPQLRELVPERADVDAQVDERTEQHVAARTREAVKVKRSHLAVPSDQRQDGSRGRTDRDRPCPDGSGLISTTSAPDRAAMAGSSAAGYTTAEVPITKKRSAPSLAAAASSNTPEGRYSPKRTTSGRNDAPQPEHRGGISLRGVGRAPHGRRNGCSARARYSRGARALLRFQLSRATIDVLCNESERMKCDAATRRVRRGLRSARRTPEGRAGTRTTPTPAVDSTRPSPRTELGRLHPAPDGGASSSPKRRHAALSGNAAPVRTTTLFAFAASLVHGSDPLFTSRKRRETNDAQARMVWVSRCASVVNSTAFATNEPEKDVW